MAEHRGIVSYGAYVPAYRLPRERIRETLGTGGGRGARTVASYDEDTTSMGVEAARRAIWDGADPAALYFATTAPAYLDKTNATAIHAALGLPADAFATDAGGSVRSGVGALRAAAGTGGLAVLSDLRTGRPGSSDEALRRPPGRRPGSSASRARAASAAPSISRRSACA
jgi:hydroxymethylglutaryl-CoA synthase